MPPKSVWWFCPIEPSELWKAKEVLVLLANGDQWIAHWACDLSGEEQPPFRGWFRDNGSGRGYVQIAQPQFWKQL